MSLNIGTATGTLDLDTSKFSMRAQAAYREIKGIFSDMDGVSSASLKTMGKNFTTAGTMLTVGLTVPLAGAGIAAGKFYKDFETSMAKVSTIADPAIKSIETMSNEVLDLSNKMGIAASDIAEATYQAISAGVDTAGSVAFVEKASKLATGGFTDVTTSVDLLTTVMNAYGYELEDVEHLSDVLISTQNKGKTTVDQLGSTMGKVIPTANAMGVQFEDLSTGLAFLTAGGISTNESVTYLNAALNEMGKSGTKAASVLKDETGKSFQQLMDEGYSLHDVFSIIDESAKESGLSLTDMFGSAEGAKAGLAILNKTSEEYNGTLEDFITTSGDTNSAFDSMADTAEYKTNVAIQRLKNNLILVGETIMVALLPVIEALSNGLQKLYDWFSGLSDGQKTFIVSIGAVLAAIGPVLLIIGQFLTALGSINSAIGTITSMFSFFTPILGAVSKAFGVLKGLMLGISAPVGAIIAVVGILIAAFKTLWDTSKEFRNQIMLAIQPVLESFETLKAKFTELGEGFLEFINGFGFEFTSIMEVLKAGWEGFCNFLAPIFTGVVETIAPIFEGLFTALGGIIDIFTGILTGDWSQIWEGFKAIISGIWTAISGVVTGIFNMLAGILGKIWEIGKGIVTGIWDGIKGAVGWFWGVLTGFVSSIWTNIKNGIKSTVSIGKDLVRGIWDGITSMASWLWDKVTGWADDLMGGIKDFFGIESPSKEFAAIGEFLMQGLGVGFEKEAPKEFAHINKVLAAGMTKVQPTLGYTPTDIDAIARTSNEIDMGYYNYRKRVNSSNSTEDFNNQQSGSGDTYNFYSPEPITEVTAAQELKKAKRDLVEGF